MAEYRIYFNTGASASVKVEADDLEDAIEKAYDKVPDVCAQCGGWGREYSLELGEWDVDDNEYEVDGEWVQVKQP